MIREVLDEHRRRLSRLAERRGAAQLKKLYDHAMAELEAKLHGLARGSGDSFTAHQLRTFIAQIRQGQYLLGRRMVGELGDISKEAQTEALRGLAKDLTKLERHFTGADIVLPIEEASHFQSVINGARPTLLRQHPESVARYSGEVITRMEDQLALSMAQGETPGAAVERVMDTADLNWWRAERIVRTESALAYGLTTARGIEECAEEIDDLMMRWTEYVDDDTDEPGDDRVGEDSIALHGQVTEPGGVFTFPSTMPDGSHVPKSYEKMIGESWPAPPNRPNDRAVVIGVRKHWGLPCWQLVNGRRRQWS